MNRFKMQDFWEQYSYELHDDDFRRYYRMDKATFQALTTYLNPKIRKYQGGRKQVRPHKMVGMTLFFLGCKLPFWQISGIFGVSEECCICSIEYILGLLVSKSSEVIKWPAKDQYRHVADAFNNNNKRFGNNDLKLNFVKFICGQAG